MILKNHIPRLLLLAASMQWFGCGTRSGVSPEKDSIKTCVQIDREPGTPQTASEINGERLFKKHCSTCHLIDKNASDANHLDGVCNRLPSRDWFSHYLRNSDSLKKSGDAYALRLDEKWNSKAEHRFRDLSANELEDLYQFLRLQ
jgi:cytochrome c2